MRNALALLGRGAVAAVRAKDASLVGTEEADTINRSRAQAEAVRAIEEAERQFTQRRQLSQDDLARRRADSQMNLEGAQAWEALHPRSRRYTETLLDGGKRKMFELDYDDASYRRELGLAPEPASYSGPTWGQGQQLKEQETMGDTWLRINGGRPEVAAEVQRVMQENPGMPRGLAAWRVRGALSANTRDLATVQGVEGREGDLSLDAMRSLILNDLDFGLPANQTPGRPAPNLPFPTSAAPAGGGVPRPAPAAPALPPVPPGYDAEAYYEALADLGKITAEQLRSWKQSRRP